MKRMEGEELDAAYRKSFADCSFFMLRFSKDGDEHILGTHGACSVTEEMREAARKRLPLVDRELDSPRRRQEAVEYIARHGSLPPCPACDRQQARSEVPYPMSLTEENAMMMGRMARWLEQ